MVPNPGAGRRIVDEVRDAIRCGAPITEHLQRRSLAALRSVRHEDGDGAHRAAAQLDNAELHALIDATYKATQVAPGLLAWIDSACDWEGKRRAGFDYDLLPPEAAIPRR